jgi:hypothetical protein
VFLVEVFMANTSAWVVGCSTRSLGLLVFLVGRRGSTDGCEWVV